VADGYQTRIGLRVVPRNLIDILALTVVVEERSHQRYTDHAGRGSVDPETMAILSEVSKDEKWHISWIRGKLEEIAQSEPGGVEKMTAAMERYREIDRQVYSELLAKERAIYASAPPTTPPAPV